jgi:hypothetical protein
MVTRVHMSKLKYCDLCASQGVSKVAQYDAATKPHWRWGYLCEEHFKSHGIGLGTGLGQKLVYDSGKE